MLAFALNAAFLAFGVAILLSLWRLVRGPDTADRLLALDTLYINALAVVLLLAMAETPDGRSLYFEVALLIALLGFVGTVAGSRFVARGDAIE